MTLTSLRLLSRTFLSCFFLSVVSLAIGIFLSHRLWQYRCHYA